MALPEPSSRGDRKKGKSNDQEDKDFDPTPEALIDEIDDERTLEEEEALNVNSGAAVQEELDALKKESEMPIEELLAYYQSMRGAEGEAESEGEDDDEEEEDEDDDEEEEDGAEDDDDVGGDDGDDDEGPAKGGDLKRHKGDSEPSDSQGDGASKSGEGSSSAQSSKPPQTDTSKSNQEVNQERDRSTHPDNKQADEFCASTQDSSTPTLNSTSSPSVSAVLKQTGGAKKASTSTDETKAPSSPTSEEAIMAKEAGSSTVDNTNPSVEPQRESSDKLQNQDASSSISLVVQENIVADREHPDQGQQRPTMTEFHLDEDDEATGMFRTLLGYDLDDSDDDDYSYTDDGNDDERDWRKSIHVGPDFQAEVPEELTEYCHLPPYENEDKLVWMCSPSTTPAHLLQYLKTASTLSKRTDISISSASVPKISYESIRLYRERMRDILLDASQGVQRENHNSGSDLAQELRDIYMSQSRKRMKLDLESDQENSFECTNHSASDVNTDQQGSSHEENSDSTSQENTKPELSTEDYFQDEEQLLYLLLQCNHNFDEALRRRRLDPFKYYFHEPMSLWSQEECLGFEHGLRIYGKDFRQIRDNKVPTRTHAEVVAFYYLWKKSERHDVYTNRYKLDRKRCLSHPGTTDYMDKFIEDNDSILNASSSSTPTLTESTAMASSSTPTTHDGSLSHSYNNNSSSSTYDRVVHIASGEHMISTLETNNHGHLLSDARH